jgi:hypothetical protein
MKTCLPLQRIRLELDRALRARPFFARAVRGSLAPSAYRELVASFRSLVRAVSFRHGRDLDARATRDLQLLSAWSDEGSSGPRCDVHEHFSAVGRSYAKCLGEDLTFDIALSVFGTSWARETASRLGRRLPVSLLSEIGTRGPRSLDDLALRLDGCDETSAHAFAFAELVRGALLGIAAGLDARWPAPSFTASIVVPN